MSVGNIVIGIFALFMDDSGKGKITISVSVVCSERITQTAFLGDISNNVDTNDIQGQYKITNLYI